MHKQKVLVSMAGETGVNTMVGGFVKLIVIAFIIIVMTGSFVGILNPVTAVNEIPGFAQSVAHWLGMAGASETVKAVGTVASKGSVLTLSMATNQTMGQFISSNYSLIGTVAIALVIFYLISHSIEGE